MVQPYTDLRYAERFILERTQLQRTRTVLLRRTLKSRRGAIQSWDLCEADDRHCDSRWTELSLHKTLRPGLRQAGPWIVHSDWSSVHCACRLVHILSLVSRCSRYFR